PSTAKVIRLNSPDHYDSVKCDLGMVSYPEDIAILTKGVRFSVNLAERVRAQGYPIKTYHCPSSDSEADIEKYIRTYARSGYHYSSTCRMAPFDKTHPGVVDDELRVHGLRVCDASIFQDVTAAHPMAPIVAITEKCASSIKRAQAKSK
ncbi:GMC oxidoreductase, partial [Guyanagaster necrorhizus]